MTINDKAKTGKFEIKLFGFNSIGEKLLSNAVGSKILSNVFQTVDSDLFSLEYIFNLNQPESRSLYNQFVGHKLRALDKESFVNHIKTSNVFDPHAKRTQKMLADLEIIEKTAEEDQNKASADRRITRLEGIKNKAQFDYSRFKVNLFRLADYENQSLRSTSFLTLLPSRTDQQNINLFQLDTNNKIKYNWFSYWGEKSVSSSNLLFKTDDQYTLQSIIGNRWSRSYRASSLTEKEYTAAKDLFLRSLPNTISAQLQWPTWNRENGSKQKFNLYREVLLTDRFFNELGSVSVNQIRQALIEILKTGTYFSALPMSVDKSMAADLKDARLTAFERHDYLNAYAKNWEQAVIPVKVVDMLNASLSASERYTKYRDLMDEVPLFSEIGELLLLKLVPESSAADFVVVRLNAAVDGKNTGDQYYPSASVYSVALEIQDKLSKENNFVINREYNLGTYLDKNGDIISETQLLKAK